uniref:Uncharacterized protein n=1 Tax=Panagrolaimus sp. ES5 TaxID=591445 RepID=A0AC34F2E4_9BILA
MCNSPRSQSAPPKQRKQEITPSQTTKSGQKHLKIDEENGGGNSHELSLFFCSPTVSNSFDMSMDLMNTSEMNNDDIDEKEEEEEHDEEDDVNFTSFSHSSASEKNMMMPSKPGNVFTFNETDVVNNSSSKSLETNIQSRPLPPLPSNYESEDIPDEPEDMAPELEMIPEPEYAYVDGDEGYEAIHHQRSISDHVLSYSQHQIDEKMKTADFLKKSNSDRSERKSIRKKPTNLSIEQYPPSSEEEEHRKLSDISEHRKTISCSTPSFLLPSINDKHDNNNDDETDDGRKRSITTDSIQSPPPPSYTSSLATSSSMSTLKQSIPKIGSSTVRGSSKMPPTRKSSDQQFSASVRLRDCSKSVSTIGGSGIETKQ